MSFQSLIDKAFEYAQALHEIPMMKEHKQKVSINGVNYTVSVKRTK